MMPVALFTYHAYGSWLADRRQGYVRKGDGIQQQDRQLAQRQRKLMTQSAVQFDQQMQRVIAERLISICVEEKFRLHTVAMEVSHAHALVSWPDGSQSLPRVGGRVKNLLSLHLSKVHRALGTKWFSKGASRKQVKDRKHFEYLMNVYLPQHKGVYWDEVNGWRE